MNILIFLKMNILNSEHFSFKDLKYRILFLSLNQELICCFSNRGDKVSMGHFKEIKVRCINIVFVCIGSKKGSTKCFSVYYFI